MHFAFVSIIIAFAGSAGLRDVHYEDSAAVRTLTRALASDTGETRVNEFLVYDAAKRIARIRLVGGFESANGGMNFNGAHAGSATITVPRGWRVSVRFLNEDSALPHSAVVIPTAAAVPALAPPAAFPGAGSSQLEEGIQVGEEGTFHFRAERTGNFFLFCAVPGHGQAGMYIRFVVSDTVAAPTYS